MLVYSVFIEINDNIEQQWISYMNTKHIKEVMRTGCFTGYQFLREAESNGKVKFRIDYHLHNMKKMNEFLDEYYQDLRNDINNHFGDKIKIERRNYKQIFSFI